MTEHPYFVAVQFHPEYTSRPLKPSPPYLGLILASSNRLENYLTNASNFNESLALSDEERHRYLMEGFLTEDSWYFQGQSVIYGEKKSYSSDEHFIKVYKQERKDACKSLDTEFDCWSVFSYQFTMLNKVVFWN